MATAHEDAASGGRRRSHGWATVFCFGSRRKRGQEASPSAEGTTTPWEWLRRRRKKRTVPVDGDVLTSSGTAADSEVTRRPSGSGTHEDESRKRKRLRLLGCCFLAPERREHSSAMDICGGSRKQRHPERTEHARSESNKKSLSEASKIKGTGGSNSNGGAEQPRGAPAETKTPRALTRPCGGARSSEAGAAGVGAFGHVVGLSVVVAVSMAGLLGGRLWAVACVCAWLAALSRLRQSVGAAAGEVAVDVDSTKHKEPVVLRGLL